MHGRKDGWEAALRRLGEAGEVDMLLQHLARLRYAGGNKPEWMITGYLPGCYVFGGVRHRVCAVYCCIATLTTQRIGAR